MSKGIKYMIISALAFSLMHLCVKYLKHLPVAELVLFRSAVSLVLCLVMLARENVNPLGNNRKVLVLRGFFGVTALSLFFYTLQYLPISTAVTIQYLSPVFTAIFAIWILKEPMRKMQWVYFLLAFIGIAIIKGFNQEVDFKFLILGIVSAMFAGLAYNMVRKLKDTDHPLVVVFYFPLVATPVMALISINSWVTPVGMDWAFLMVLGVFGQIAQLYMTKGLQSARANKIASLKYVGILFALFFDIVLFDVIPQWFTLVGIVLVIAGVVLNVIKPFQFYKSKMGK